MSKKIAVNNTATLTTNKSKSTKSTTKSSLSQVEPHYQRSAFWIFRDKVREQDNKIAATQVIFFT